MSFGRFGSLAIACAILLVGCTPGRQSEPGGSAGGQPASQFKRMVVVSREEPVVLNDKAAVSGNGDVVEELVSAGLVRFEPLGDAQPLMAEAVPTLENGLVKLAPGGRMETTWHLKQGVTWHDGSPVTTEDVL